MYFLKKTKIFPWKFLMHVIDVYTSYVFVDIYASFSSSLSLQIMHERYQNFTNIAAGFLEVIILAGN